MSRECIVHKAVELRKVKKKLRPSEEELTHNYICQLKYDGCNMVAIKSRQMLPDEAEGEDSAVVLLSRTGEDVLSAKHLQGLIGKAPFMPLGVYLGEYWHPTIDQATLSGYFRDTKKQHPEAHFVVFDYLTEEEWQAGKSELTYVQRTARLPNLFFQIDTERALVYPAESQGQLVDEGLGTEEAARMVSNYGHYDGIILRKPEGQWKRGSGTDGEIVKIKPTLTLDLRVLYTKEDVGEKTGRKVFTVVVQLPNGQEQEVGSGVPHQEDAVPKKGDIVEIEAMSYTKNGLLREPRFKGIRHDKGEPDDS